MKGGFWHPNAQRGWKDVGSMPGYARGQITDEQYYAQLAIHDPLWRYIIAHYDKEIYRHQNITPVTILGYRSLPVAIELSQWGYDITVLADKYEDLRKIKRDCEIQAGRLQKCIFFNYRQNVPRGCVICFIGIIEDLPEDRMYHFLDTCIAQNREVVFAVRADRDWAEVLERYEVKVLPYPVGKYVFISLQQPASHHK